MGKQEEKKLTARQRAYLGLLLNNYIDGRKKLSKDEMAEQLGVSRQTLNNWEHLPAFSREYNNAVRSSLNAAAIAAAQTMVDLLSADDERARLGAAKDLLDRTGFKPKDVVDVSGVEPVIIIDDMGG